MKKPPILRRNKMTNQQMIEEIYANVLPMLEELGAEDTTEHRLWALEGLAEAWKEDSDSSFEKTFWRLALTQEICTLKIKLSFHKIRT